MYVQVTHLDKDDTVKMWVHKGDIHNILMCVELTQYDM